MPSPFPGMDPYLEINPIFHELHSQILGEAQAQLQPQLRPKYLAWMESHLSEGSVWGTEAGAITLERKEPDVTITSTLSEARKSGSTAALAKPTALSVEELDPDELELRKQRRIVIYLQGKSRMAVTSIELLSPSNKDAGTVGQVRYLEKRSSALHGGLHWVEIDLLRGGKRPPMNVALPRHFDYLAYVAQAIPTGWSHLLYAWKLRDPLPRLPIPLLGTDQAFLDLAACFRSAYDRIAADDKADYLQEPPPPPLRSKDRAWVKSLLREKGFRKRT